VVNAIQEHISRVFLRKVLRIIPGFLKEENPYFWAGSEGDAKVLLKKGISNTAWKSGQQEKKLCHLFFAHVSNQRMHEFNSKDKYSHTTHTKCDVTTSKSDKRQIRTLGNVLRRIIGSSKTPLKAQENHECPAQQRRDSSNPRKS